jgi:hypothetical protein
LRPLDPVGAASALLGFLSVREGTALAVP